MNETNFKIDYEKRQAKDSYLVLLLISELLKYLDDIVFFTNSKELKIIDNIKKQYHKLLSNR